LEGVEEEEGFLPFVTVDLNHAFNFEFEAVVLADAPVVISGIAS
jgi:hypothetical protein